jgi:hypothetical protein
MFDVESLTRYSCTYNYYRGQSNIQNVTSVTCIPSETYCAVKNPKYFILIDRIQYFSLFRDYTLHIQHHLIVAYIVLITILATS